MAAYISNVPTPPRIMTRAQQELLLKVTGEHRDGFRDHLIFSLALATALREHEIVALNVGDLVTTGGGVRRVVRLRVFKRSTDDPALQEVVLPEALRAKVAKFLRWKNGRGESLAAEAPFFLSNRQGRLSTRHLRSLIRKWQERAGFEHFFGFHNLRHCACTNLYRETKDLRLTQRFARHKSVSSTERYAHPSVEELIAAVQSLPC